MSAVLKRPEDNSLWVDGLDRIYRVTSTTEQRIYCKHFGMPLSMKYEEFNNEMRTLESFLKDQEKLGMLP